MESKEDYFSEKQISITFVITEISQFKISMFLNSNGRNFCIYEFTFKLITCTYTILEEFADERVNENKS